MKFLKQKCFLFKQNQISRLFILLTSVFSHFSPISYIFQNPPPINPETMASAHPVHQPRDIWNPTTAKQSETRYILTTSTQCQPSPEQFACPQYMSYARSAWIKPPFINEYEEITTGQRCAIELRDCRINCEPTDQVLPMTKTQLTRWAVDIFFIKWT